MTDLDMHAIEARKMGLKQSRRKDGDWLDVTFQIHPDEAYKVGIANMPLGTRVSLVVARLAEEDGKAQEQPSEAATERPKGGPLSQEAGRLCRSSAFRAYLSAQHNLNWAGNSDSEMAARVIRELCAVSSRAELDYDEAASNIFRTIADDFYCSQLGQTDASLKEQARL